MHTLRLFFLVAIASLTIGAPKAEAIGKITLRSDPDCDHVEIKPSRPEHAHLCAVAFSSGGVSGIALVPRQLKEAYYREGFNGTFFVEMEYGVVKRFARYAWNPVQGTASEGEREAGLSMGQIRLASDPDCDKHMVEPARLEEKGLCVAAYSAGGISGIARVPRALKEAYYQGKFDPAFHVIMRQGRVTRFSRSPLPVGEEASQEDGASTDAGSAL